jgi:sodium-dependent dicarboxylate transporter 2/3/5
MAAHIDPLILMVPAAMSASCAFMLPVATAPNAVVFGTGQIGIQTMVRWGIWVNVLGVLVISAVVFGVTAAR